METVRGKQHIRHALAEVESLRSKVEELPEHLLALGLVKRYQCVRFEATYSDLISTSSYGPACRFFLDELYSPKDFSQRDAEFSRIAGTIERIFPRSIVEVACRLAELHALTEKLDVAMAASIMELQLLEADTPYLNDAIYRAAWRHIGRTKERRHQLESVLLLGNSLGKVTKVPGIRFTLRAMRRPAAAAHLSNLQMFLEKGFDTFAAMAKRAESVQHFLEVIEQRESSWIERMTQ
jgi:hypothetical protein